MKNQFTNIPINSRVSRGRAWTVRLSVLIFTAFKLAGLSSFAGTPVINEFMASSETIYPDNCDFDDYSDWIELYNPAPTNVVMTNYFFTDDLTQPFKWFIPNGATIPANGYLMFRADGFDAAPGEVHNRIYWPWITTFVTKRYHTGFKLSADGEAIGLYRSSTPPVDTTLIATNAVWKYRDTGTNPGTNWMSLTYDDSTWAQGPAQLGYGDGDEATVVSYGTNANNKFPTTHFRHHFNVTDPTRLGNIRLRLVVDDGAILYLNGAEFARLRMPMGTVTHTNYATALPPTENAFETVELSRSFFRAGDNVLAVEVHQEAPNSSDISWNAELIVSEITGSPILVDSVTFGSQTSDVSYGRNATNGWSFFGSPTPEGPNNTEPLAQLVRAPAVTASLASGFYTGAGSVTLSSTGAVTAVRYTLDGSVPSVNSAVYSNAVVITNNTILRARAFMTGLIPGPVLTRSYFLNEPTNRTLPVVSFVADPATLFNPVIGIYSNNTPYAFKGREIPARVEFFETNQTLGFAVSCGIRIGGENAWAVAQKPLNIHMRSKWGDDVITYQIFPGDPTATFGELMFRNGGDNWAQDMLRDGMMSVVLRGQAQNDLQSFRPCVVFVNGQYWGIQDIRKQFDPVYFANTHQLAEDTYDVDQYAHNEIGVIALRADTGNTETYEAFDALYTTRDLSQQTNYDAMLAQMNVDSFIDYVSSEDFGVNTSWAHNREFWSARAPGSKWIWNVPDFDRCFDTNNVTSSLIDDFRTSYPLFRALTNNPTFINRLLQRYAAHMGSTLSSNRVSSILDSLAAQEDAEMPRHIARWATSGGVPSLASRQTWINRIKEFLIRRPPNAVSHLQAELGINRGQANLAVALSPFAGGNVRIAGVPMTPEFNTNIALFKNTPVELAAEPAPGYVFAGWSNGNTNPTIQLTLTADSAITATFVAGGETILPDTISANTTLTSAASPYSVTNDLIVPANVTLTIGPGVKFLMPAGRSIYVYGALQVNGTSNSPVQMLARGSEPWGNLCFVNATGPSTLSNLVIRSTSPSRRDPSNLKAAVSGYNSTIMLDGVDIEANLPVFARFGTVTLRNSRIHVLFTGDGINLKSAGGTVENCAFTGLGNVAPDTDAIDFDNVTNGLIRANHIYVFRGDNCDAIDVGEGCRNLLVVSNRIFNIFDKGVSVGQASEVRIERNLIVNCGIGVGVKDFNSTARIDQDTFARNSVGVAVYEKNLGAGGGIAFVTNCIFSRSKDAQVTVDSLSSLTVRYSLSDTLPLPGANNLVADPLFNDAGAYDFSLKSASPAVNTGDPSHPLDGDGSRADIGAYYVYSTNDYPYVVPNIVVINELLAHSHDAASDWIELYNNSAQPVNIGGWYLSDNPDVPQKYRVADGTFIPGNGYLVFYQNTSFGTTNTDPGALVPFALSENGESVNLFGPSDGLRPDYNEKEDFGASATGVSFGRYFKASTRTYNFVSMAMPTPDGPNSAPLVGPIVISEIMYHPPTADAEYLELANVTTNSVMLFDTNTSTPWRITQGVTHDFPASPPLTLAPREKILLVRSSSIFGQNYTPPNGTRVFQWTSGSLDNGGETIELSKPGDVDTSGVRQFVRVDLVDYSDSSPWPIGADGSGTSLVRINERAYGNDFANWSESDPTPGQTSYQAWSANQSFPTGESGPDADPDSDGISNGVEYALGSNPLVASSVDWEIRLDHGAIEVLYTTAVSRPDVVCTIQKAADASFTTWTDLNVMATPFNGSLVLQATDASGDAAAFYRLSVKLFNQ